MLLKRLLLCSLPCFVFVSSLKISSHANEANLDENTYAVICESNSSPLIINASDVDIDGLMYSNCDIIATTAQINQRDNYQCDYYVENFSTEFMSFNNNVQSYDNAYICNGFSLEGLNVFGLESIGASSYKLSVDEMLGANSSVKINSAIFESSSSTEDSVVFASNGDIEISANKIDFDGVIYAPNGKVVINANDVEICGLIIADEVEINCSNLDIEANPDLIDKYGIALYTMGEASENIDIMSAAGSSGVDISGGTKWYYNTGTDVVTKASYGKNKLLQTVKKGDIIHERRTWEYLSPGSIVGHEACVEGIYYLPVGGSTSKTYKYNIRIIEAISSGVCRSVLDDTRCADNNVTILRYNDTIDSKNMARIIYFLTAQLGKEYSMDMGRSTSINSKTWYCSELVRAAYYYVGLDIEDGNLGAITPGDIKDCVNLKEVCYKNGCGGSF